MIKLKKIRCAIYDRVSTELQARDGLSLDTQKHLLTDYASSHGYEIVGYYADEGITARKKLQNRKDFMRLLEDIQKDKIDLVLVTKLDRWFRNVRDYHNTQAILETHHCNWKTILEDYDTSTADGQLKINIMLAVAQNECDRTSERIKSVFSYKKSKGEHLTGKAPYGYRVVNKKLQKDDAAEEIVNELFRYYFSCFSKRKTIDYILEEYGEQAPTPSQAERILTSPIYAGIRENNFNYCPAYITREQHRQIRQTCAAKTYPAAKEPYLFSGLLKCPVCGMNMTGFVKKQTLKDGTIHRYKRYRCSRKFNRHPNGACISESVVEDYLLSSLNLELQKKIYKIKELQQKKAKKDLSPKIQAEMNRLNLLFQKGRIEESYYEEQYSLLSERLQEETRKHDTSLLENYRRLEKQVIGDWQSLYETLDPVHKKAFWKRILKDIRLDPDTHKVSGFDFFV